MLMPNATRERMPDEYEFIGRSKYSPISAKSATKSMMRRIERPVAP